jgi:hypothetical protein
LAPVRRKPELDHLVHAASIHGTALDEIRRLAAQLKDQSVLPILGAGASYDCGVRLANEIGQDLHDAYLADPSFHPHRPVSPNLGKVAEVIAQERNDDLAAIEAIGLDRADLWPPSSDIPPHYCAYRPLSRLAREGHYEQAIGFNYDCNTEAGMLAEGFRRAGGHTVGGQHWHDRVHVVTDAQSSTATLRRAFDFYKAHGCAARFRECLPYEGAVAAERIVLQEKDLTSWQGREWAENRLRTLATDHILLLIGFSGSDPTVVGALKDALSQVYRAAPSEGAPRVIVLDHAPDTMELTRLVKLGLGDEDARPGMVTHIDTSVCSVTGVLTALLAETLVLELDGPLATCGAALSTDQDARLAELVVSLPLMLRWSYLLTAGQPEKFLQRATLQQAAKSGYVPLTHDAAATVRLLMSRRDLRQRLTGALTESLAEASQHEGFVIGSGVAYLPIDATHEQLRQLCRPGGHIESVRGDLNVPALDAALVATQGPQTHAIHLRTGAEVEIR